MSEEKVSEAPSKSLSATPMQTEAVAVERYQYQPNAPIASVGTLKAMLEGQREALLALLPAHVTIERLQRLMLISVNRMPKLLECTQSSVVEAIQQAGSLGLDIGGTLQEAWILPFNNRIQINGKDTWVSQATLIPGYRGLAKLARQSGEVSRIDSQVVCTGDHFELEMGTTPKLVFRPLIGGDRGKPLGAYSLVVLTSGEQLVEWMDVAQIEKVRKQSKQANSLMWTEFWDEGARKTVFRRLAKRTPLSAEKAQAFAAAVEASDREFDLDRLAAAVDVTAREGASGVKPEDLRKAASAPKEAKAAEKAKAATEPAQEAAAGGSQASLLGEQPAGSVVRMNDDMIQAVKEQVYEDGVSLEAVEEHFGCKLHEIEGPSEMAISARVMGVVNEIKAKAAKDGDK